jgi:DNA polymerase-1
MTPYSLDAYNLFHAGALAFADIEATGIRVDTAYLKNQYSSLTTQITNAEKALWKMKEMREWKSRFADKTNIDSTTQLSTILFKVLDYKPTKATARGNAAVDDEVLRRIGTPFTKTILAKRKLTKVRDTYITGLLREQTDGLLHPSFNLHMVQTFRSSSDGPNFQNIPVRDPKQGGVIRRAIIPHNPTDIIGEIDFGAIEVRVAACYHKDPTMLAYLNDPTKDLHREMACECFLLEPGQVTKEIRNVAKGGFVFAEFYGSYFELVGPSLWAQSVDLPLFGRSLRDWLVGKGLKTRDQFTDHIQEIERHFWEVRFPVYDQWRRDWYAAYLERGWFDTITGFRCQGPMRKNECINYPVQGSAFHVLLWSMSKIHQWLKANEMGSKIVGQIHDSILFNLHPDELDTVLKKAKQIMCVDVRKHYPWLICPLVVETELAPAGASWNEKTKQEET